METTPTAKEKVLLEKLQPIVRQKLSYTIVKANQELLPVRLFSGLRTYAEQNRLYAKGRTEPGNIITNAKGGYSRHNFGLAGDIVFCENGRWSWDYSKYAYNRLGQIGKEAGLIWGGDWSFIDPPHFQYTAGIRRVELRTLYDKGGLELVYTEVTKRHNLKEKG